VNIEATNAGQFFWEASVLMNKGQLVPDTTTTLILSTLMMYAGSHTDETVNAVVRILTREGVSRSSAIDIYAYVDGWSDRAASKKAKAVYSEMTHTMWAAIAAMDDMGERRALQHWIP
jgi:hypothetical protein